MLRQEVQSNCVVLHLMYNVETCRVLANLDEPCTNLNERVTYVNKYGLVLFCSLKIESHYANCFG